MHQKLSIFLLAGMFLFGCASGSMQADDQAQPFAAVSSAADTISADPTQAMRRQDGSSMPMFDSSCPARSKVTQEDTAPLRSNVRFVSGFRSFDADDGTMLLYESYDEGVFSTADPSIEQWVNGILSQINEDYHSFSQEMLTTARSHHQDFQDTFYCYSNYLTMGVGRHDSRVLSLLTLSSVYSGGAHPSSLQTAYNLDLVRKTQLRLEDVILPEGESVIRQSVQNELEHRFMDGDTLMLYEGYTDTLDSMLSYGTMTQNWYLNQEGLVIYFNQYEIAPYAAGIIKVEIPYTELEDVLQEEFAPPAAGEGPGSAVLLTAAEDAPEDLRIGIEGSVVRLRVMKEQWMDGACIASKMVLSAGNPCSHEVFSFSGELDPGEVFSVEYFTENGEAKKYYISDGALVEDWPQ